MSLNRRIVDSSILMTPPRWDYSRVAARVTRGWRRMKWGVRRVGAGKLLHAIHGMLRTDTDFAGEKFYALEG